jgi:hypothetical protein
MLYNSMLHNILMYVTPCYITRACYVSCYKTCNTTASVYCCIVAGHATSIVVHPPSPEASESEHGGGSTGVPEWQLLDWDDYDFPDCMNCFFFASKFTLFATDFQVFATHPLLSPTPLYFRGVSPLR